MKEVKVIGTTADKFQIYVDSSSHCKIPHFHCSKRKGFDAALSFINGEYVFHDNALDVLETNEINNLIKFMRNKDINSNQTNWQVLLDSWNKNNPRCQIDGNRMPNYSYLGTL